MFAQTYAILAETTGTPWNEYVICVVLSAGEKVEYYIILMFTLTIWDY